MNASSRRITVEVAQVKSLGDVAVRGWTASAELVVTGVDGRQARGWAHFAKAGGRVKVDSFDAYEEADPGLFAYALATQAEVVLAAVRAKIEQLRLAA